MDSEPLSRAAPELAGTAAGGDAGPGGREPAGDGRSERPLAEGRPVAGTVHGEVRTPGGTGDAGDAGGAGERARTRGAHRRRRSRRWMVEWAVIVAVALVVALVVRTYVAQTFFIPSGSMYPTLKVGDRIVIDKLAYHIHAVHRGDIVVFHHPPAEVDKCAGPPVTDLVKRVIGLPGNTVSARGGQVYINGKVLPEPWLPNAPSSHTANFGPVTVPPHDYFVMGDNRVNSCDSRTWGPVPGSDILGKVDFIIWPLSAFHFF